MCQLDPAIKKDIIACCKKYNANKVILFGSRARGDNGPYSDIDLAIKGADNFDRLFAELKYNEFTLLDMDIIDLDGRVSEPLMKDILNDGHILYERTGKSTEKLKTFFQALILYMKLPLLTILKTKLF